MKTVVWVLFSISAYGWVGQSRKADTGKATASGECSVAPSGDGDTIIIKNCGIGAEQGDKIIALLKAVLAGQNLNDINTKLDELLRLASPTPIKVTIDYNISAPPSPPSTDGHPRTWVRFYTDRVWVPGDFAIICDRDCTGDYLSLCSLPGYSRGGWGTLPGESKIVALVFNVYRN
jgi:hypothetical protein